MSNGPTEQFTEACGLAGAFRVQVEGPGQLDRSTFEFHQPFLVVGRDPLADLTIDDQEVGPRHAFLQVIAGRVFCLNIGNRSGIHWEEGPRLASWVESGNGIRIGSVRLRFGDLEAGKGGSLPLSEEFEWPSEVEARLEFLGADSSRKPWQITRSLSLLGSSPTCRVHLPGPGVGRMHAALVRTPSGIWAVDLLGPGGMMVRGASTRYALLGDGDEIQVGPHRMRFVIGPAVETSERTELARRTPDRVVQPARITADLKPTILAEVSDATLGREALSVSLDSAITNKLLEEFDRMHQRTVDQFQQAIMMMFRMHQDQMETIRDELARLDRLEDEQKAIRVELSRTNPPQPQPQPQPQRLGLRLDSAEASYAPPRPKARIPEEAEPAPAEANGRKRPVTPATEARVSEQTAPPINGHQAERISPALFESNPDPHARLAQRIAEIHEERQGLWKRIMASLSGDTSEKRLP